jgi:N-acetylmuramoyl-L-alanine amidase
VKKRIYFAIVLLGVVLLASFTIIKPGKGYTIKTVVIDAGHGGKDPGCHGEKYNEKTIALAVALKLGKYIEEHFPDVKVVYTRKTDIFLELSERAAIANRANADLFICIHCNASPNKSACGSETYVMGLHKSKGNLDVAKRENESIKYEDDYKTKYAGTDSDEWIIISTLEQAANLDKALKLAAYMQHEYTTKAARKDKGVKQAGFLVLWKTTMPSLLTEIGFLTNPDEEKFLGSEKGQTYIASSIFRAFRKYKTEMEGKTAKFNDAIENQEPYDASRDSLLIADQKEEVPKEIKIEDKNKPVNDKKEDAPKKEAPGKDTAVKKDDPKKDEPKKDAVVKKDEPKNTDDKKTGDPLNKDEPGKEEPKKADPVVKNDDPAVESPKEDKLPMTPEELKKKELEAIEEASKLLNAKADEQAVAFRVQIASSDKKLPLDSEKFKGLEDVWEYQVNGVYKYTAGKFTEQGPAVKLQNELRKRGFSDAFVVAFRGGKRIPLNDLNKPPKP